MTSTTDGHGAGLDRSAAPNVNGSVTPTRGLDARVLTLSRNEVGRASRKRSDANEVSGALALGAPKGGAAVTALIRGRIRAGEAAVTLSLTTRSGIEADARAGLDHLVAALARRAGGVTLLAALANDGASARWHLHAVFFGPAAEIDALWVVTAWRKAWPQGQRPVLAAQRVTNVAARDVRHVVAHHLHRAGGTDRITLAGPLAAALARPLGLKPRPGADHVAGGQGGHSRSTKASTKPLQVAATTALRAPCTCPWCGRALPVGCRRDAVFHADCRRSTSRAMRALSANHGASAGALAKGLAKEGWLVRPAIRAAIKALDEHEWSGLPETEPVRKPTRGPACECSRPLANRVDATTCGRSTCRTRAHRKRSRLKNVPRTDRHRWVHLSEEQKAARRARRFVSALVRTHRHLLFTVNDARILGARFHLSSTAVDTLLRELVHEDGTAFVVFGTDNLYGFVPLHRRGAA